MKGGGSMENIIEMISSCNDLHLLMSLMEDARRCHDYPLAREINRRIAFLKLKK